MLIPINLTNVVIELGYGIHQGETSAMNKSPIGVGIKGLLHGFSALYGLFIGGFLLVFTMSFILSGVLQLVVMWFGLIGLLAFSVLGVILKIRKPDIFLVKEEHLLTIKLEGSKIPDGGIITEMTSIGSPKKHPQIEEAKEQQEEAQ